MLKKIGKRLKDQRGLTLIELLAVVVILGVIAAIAVPSIGDIIAKSKYDAAKADVVQLLNAGKLYVASEGSPSTEQTFSKTTPGDLANFVEITDKNLSDWSVKVSTKGEVTVSATFNHPNKAGSKDTLSDKKLSDIEKYQYKGTTN